ncbi:MAG: acyltransferase family protein [Alphaproteobacteria bacterium]|nr:acyltransferase family protein [Alphaproteobacteria bacterium]MBU1516893.1 acyltransferase family protein [Alphaproteobacteria bacterium]MBU2092588.1 acyltransferase family protein [Alphaproteobacteria bacterium]MBU2151301.1 acyltransferase family protein [Alphaproteobacteria bacterium]MBU2309603.1 acyltransferase family protein [Alphaproteobacteria bacterium]
MPAATRRYDLDALRVGAFLLLLLYHLGMFYVSWDWHVKSSHILPGLEPWMGVLNPWRLSLLFVISGAATRFMSEKGATGELAAQRSQRLLIPLAFGMILIVAPQSWAQVVEQKGYTGSFLDFWPRYLTFDSSFGIILPTYNHLWFVVYLWVYTMLALLLRPFWPAMDRAVAWLLKGPALVILPALLFGLYRATAERAWGETHIVWADGYAHLQYGTGFLLGLLMARTDAAWDFLARRRLAILAGVGVALAVGLFLRRYEYAEDSGWLGVMAAFVREAYAWTTICALFGYARRYIRSGSPLLTTLTEAVFPFYIIHQTAIVLAGHFLKPVGLPVLVEAGTILAIEVAACLATYGLALAVPILRLPLGLKPASRPARASVVAAE